ncbi:hypothetical protein GGX14DRAFT_576832 [Mycena pura]|uniref:Uncharacterized protein n=1 Tax=Mycena pura TaxID=153505 RepID=A0AAD6UWU6_9AGAR|nr:hypothetical protein GGX14DRAFT_576832 [Mycena pura]
MAPTVDFNEATAPPKPRPPFCEAPARRPPADAPPVLLPPLPGIPERFGGCASGGQEDLMDIDSPTLNPVSLDAPTPPPLDAFFPEAISLSTEGMNLDGSGSDSFDTDSSDDPRADSSANKENRLTREDFDPELWQALEKHSKVHSEHENPSATEKQLVKQENDAGNVHDLWTPPPAKRHPTLPYVCPNRGCIDPVPAQPMAALLHAFEQRRKMILERGLDCDEFQDLQKRVCAAHTVVSTH